MWLQAPYAKAYILRYSMHATHIIVFISHYSVPYTPKQHGSMDQYTSQKNSKTKTTFVWGSGNSFYTYTKKVDFVIKWSHAIAYSWRILQIGFSGLDSPDWILQIGFSRLGRPNLERPNLGRPDLGDAKFGEVKFGEAKFGEAKFWGAKFGEANFGKAKFGNAKFGESQFGKAKFGEAKFGDAKFGEAKFGEGQIRGGGGEQIWGG